MMYLNFNFLSCEMDFDDIDAPLWDGMLFKALRQGSEQTHHFQEQVDGSQQKAMHCGNFKVHMASRAALASQRDF